MTRKKRIAWIEDLPGLSSEFYDWLTKDEGFEVDIYKSYEEAKARRGEIRRADLVLVDATLQHGGGNQHPLVAVNLGSTLAIELRKQFGHRPPIAILSSFSTSPAVVNRTQLESAGVTVMDKSETLQDLRVRFADLLGHA